MFVPFRLLCKPNQYVLKHFKYVVRPFSSTALLFCPMTEQVAGRLQAGYSPAGLPDFEVYSLAGE
jgi:hypothetical protein